MNEKYIENFGESTDVLPDVAIEDGEEHEI